jgi:hypothetical protein
MQRKRTGTSPVERQATNRSGSSSGQDRRFSRVTPTAPPTVSARWLLTAVGLALLAAAACAWGALCLLFWQGSWQLLYHPSSAITRTPASVSLPFNPVGFATTESGQPRLKGWWIPAAQDAPLSRFTVLYLHGQNGNLGNSVDTLANLHAVGLNVLAFDYRGYGQSQFAHPSEARWREDVEWALQYLTATRHVAPGSILLDGRELGANLALEVAAAHSDLAGVILESPMDTPLSAVFDDPRAHLVPAHFLVRDQYDLNAPASSLKVPSLWFLQSAGNSQSGRPEQLRAFEKVIAPKMQVWFSSSTTERTDFGKSLARWLDDLHH